MWRKGRQSWEKFKQGHILSHRDTQFFPVHPLLAPPSEADLHSPHLQTHSTPFGLQLCLIRIPGKSQTSPQQTIPLSRLGKKKKKNPLFPSCLVAQGELWFSLAETIVMDEKNQNHLHPLRLLRIPTAPGAPILGFLHCLYSLCGGEPGYDCDHQNQSQTSHPHVILSQPSLLS